jgi:hypothetical protein
VDRTGSYVFFQISNDATQIAKLELAAKKVVDAGNYVAGNVLGLSRDNALVYTENDGLSYPFSCRYRYSIQPQKSHVQRRTD